MTKRHVDQKASDYRPTRGTIDAPRGAPSSILRAVEKGGEIQLSTLTEMLELFRAKTDYHVHVEVAVLPSKSALLKTIDNERDAQETIRRLKAKP
jgi:ABC-type ATPase with predicted acetyltransferase domain